MPNMLFHSKPDIDLIILWKIIYHLPIDFCSTESSGILAMLIKLQRNGMRNHLLHHFHYIYEIFVKHCNVRDNVRVITANILLYWSHDDQFLLPNI